MGDYLTTTYGFDDANRLLSLLHTEPAGTVEDLSYAYDPNGNRRSFTRAGVSLPTAAPMSGTDYDGSNEMLAQDDFDLVYDDNGNLTSKTDRVTLEETTYYWDARNRIP